MSRFYRRQSYISNCRTRPPIRFNVSRLAFVMHVKAMAKLLKVAVGDWWRWSSATGPAEGDRAEHTGIDPTAGASCMASRWAGEVGRLGVGRETARSVKRVCGRFARARLQHRFVAARVPCRSQRGSHDLLAQSRASQGLVNDDVLDDRVRRRGTSEVRDDIQVRRGDDDSVGF